MIYAMDREFYTLRQIETLLSGAGQEVRCFCYLYQLTIAMEQSVPDVVLIESEVPILLQYANNLRTSYPGVKLIFVSKNDILTAEQMNFQPDGWLSKPLTKEKLQQQLLRAVHPKTARKQFCQKGI